MKNRNNIHLGGGISIQDLAAALTDPEKRFEFPIKPIETKIEFTPNAAGVIIGAAAILAAGAIITASVLRNH